MRLWEAVDSRDCGLTQLICPDWPTACVPGLAHDYKRTARAGCETRAGKLMLTSTLARITSGFDPFRLALRLHSLHLHTVPERNERSPLPLPGCIYLVPRCKCTLEVRRCLRVYTPELHNHSVQLPCVIAEESIDYDLWKTGLVVAVLRFEQTRFCPFCTELRSTRVVPSLEHQLLMSSFNISALHSLW